MDATFLITIVVRKTADLVAAIATQGGARHSLVDVPSRFHDALAEAIDARDVPRKVAAEMFGVGLRTHQRRLKQADAARDSKRETLSAQLYRFVSAEGAVSAAELASAFSATPPHVLASALRDLKKNALLLKSTVGGEPKYTTSSRSGVLQESDSAHVLQHFLSALVHRLGPVAVRDLCPLVDEPVARVEAALAALERDGFLHSEGEGDARVWASHGQMPRMGTPRRLATLADHFVAVLTNLMDAVGEHDPAAMETSPRSTGLSVVVELPEGHELIAELHEAFRVFRTTLADIRQRAEAIPTTPDGGGTIRLSTYAGSRVAAARGG